MELRRITPTDGPALKAIRLQSLATDNAAFAIHRDQLAALSDADWTDVCRKNAHDDANTILVAVLDGIVVGMVGCRQDISPKLQHCGMVWGMYVAPPQRGSGVGRRLLAAVREHGMGQSYTMLKLSVTNHSAAALALYSRAGFTAYAHEPALLCIDGITYDACHMMYTYPRK